MHLEVLVEEPSAEAALEILLPRLVGPEVEIRLHPHQGKQDLLAALPGKLRGVFAVAARGLVCRGSRRP